MIITKAGWLRFALFAIVLCCTVICRGQFFDSLQVKAGLQYRFSSKDYLPFWLVSNQYGTVADIKNDITSYVRISNKHVIGEKEYQNDHGFYDYNDISFSYGLSLYVNNHFKRALIEEGYGKLEYKNWAIRAGRFEETTGDIDPQLSSGSLGVSGNALPIPKIEIAVTNYTNIPFTSGWLQFRGTFAHGWLGTNRYVRKPYYHEKTFFLRVGPDRLKFYGGIKHFAEWGGQRGNQQFDKSLKSFWNMVFAKEPGPANPENTTGVYEGDQRGVLEGGFYWENNDIALHGYMQRPFEGKNDISLRNKNALTGFSLSMKNNYTGLQKIVFEFISTKYINPHTPSNQRESFYNNSSYKTGWEYENNIIGTPLFINRSRGSNYFPGIQPFDWNAPDSSLPGNANIINNRVRGIHMGALYIISARLQGKTLLTYTENYGTISINAPFGAGKNEFYGLQQISYDIPKKNLSLIAGFGFDFGQLSKTAVAGVLLGIEWNITGHADNDDW
jgi:hypothetical protein